MPVMNIAEVGRAYNSRAEMTNHRNSYWGVKWLAKVERGGYYRSMMMNAGRISSISLSGLSITNDQL
jgi:hypothetical protein